MNNSKHGQRIKRIEECVEGRKESIYSFVFLHLGIIGECSVDMGQVCLSDETQSHADNGALLLAATGRLDKLINGQSYYPF